MACMSNKVGFNTDRILDSVDGFVNVSIEGWGVVEMVGMLDLQNFE